MTIAKRAEPAGLVILMPVFGPRYYKLGTDHYLNVEGYQTALRAALAECASAAERDLLLRGEAVEMTRHVTDGIRDLIRHDRRIKRLVLDLGLLPLATWAEALDTMAQHPLPALQRKIAEMRRDLE